MKVLNKIFYDILLKLHYKKSDKFEISKNLIEKYLLEDIKNRDEFIDKITKYLESFYHFCFVLDDNIMLKGEIDFKF